MIDFETFLRDYQDMVYTTAVRLLGDRAEAQDAAQEAFLKAYERFDELKTSPTAGGWLKTVTTNICLNHLERYRNRFKLFSAFVSDDDEAAPLDFPGEAGPEAPLAARIDAARLQEALEALAAAQRVPLVLFHFDDMDYESIAAKLGVSLAKVKSDIFRGRQALRRALGER